VSRAQREYERGRRLERAGAEAFVEALVLLRLSRDPMARAIWSWGLPDRSKRRRAAFTLSMMAAVCSPYV
jgi:hypothetical protein